MTGLPLCLSDIVTSYTTQDYRDSMAHLPDSVQNYAVGVHALENYIKKNPVTDVNRAALKLLVQECQDNYHLALIDPKVGIVMADPIVKRQEGYDAIYKDYMEAIDPESILKGDVVTVESITSSSSIRISSDTGMSNVEPDIEIDGLRETFSLGDEDLPAPHTVGCSPIGCSIA